MNDLLLYTRPGGQDKKRVAIGVPVVTYNDDESVSFYHQGQARSFQRITYEVMQGGSRRQQVKQAVLHFDGMRTGRGCFSVLVQRRLSTHIIIDWDGTVYQPLDLADVAYHAPPTNATSVGIDLNNPVRRSRVSDARLEAHNGMFRGRINGGKTVSMGYTDAQYDSLIAVINGLREIFPNIKPEAPIGEDGKVLRNKLADPDFAGVVGHLHLSANKWDPGPGFDWERLLIGIRGNRMHFPVTLPGTRNLAQVPKRTAMTTAEPYFRNTEEGDGGYFPVGVNQAWHTGVHLRAPAGTPVLAPAAGRVMVVRNVGDTPLGSPNVVVIKHELKIGGADKVFFSVLSHLRKETHGTSSPVPWLRRLALSPDQEGALPDFDGLGEAPSAKGEIALRNDRVALVDVEVKAGELVGHVGEINARIDGKGEKQALLDFAIIAPQPLLPTDDPTFERVDEDEDPGLLCNARSVWKRIVRDDPEALRGLIAGGYPLAPEEIQAAYSDPKIATQMRWLAVRHVTEWSRDTEFSDLFGGGVDFEWHARTKAERYVAKIGKFLWWDENVTKHTGLPADRRVWAYHPVALLAVLSIEEARRAFTPGEGGVRQQLEGDALAEARRADAELERSENFVTHYGEIQIEDDVDAIDLDELGEEEDETEGWLRWEQGEWEP